MLQVSKPKVTNWQGQEVVRLHGDRKGQKAKILEVGTDARGSLIMTIQYTDGKKAYYCSPFNYAVAKHLKEYLKEKPYRPRPKTIQKVKEIVTDEESIIEIGDKKYVPILYGRIRPQALRHLIGQGFLEKAGTLKSVLQSPELSWQDYREAKARKRLPWSEKNVIVYKILKDITELP